MTRALFIVDVQNDFTEGGALGVDGGAQVAAAITAFLQQRRADYRVVLASRDWHEAVGDNGGHFATVATPDFVTTWPVHCVGGTPGADYHPALDTAAIDIHVRKGMGVPAYSLFEGVTGAGDRVGPLLDGLVIDEIDVVGIATDYCVRASALDALGAGRRVRVFSDLVAGVAPASSAAAFEELRAAGAAVVTSDTMGVAGAAPSATTLLPSDGAAATA